MKGDNSRDTFRREMHYRGVRMQQGRVQLDADWNELGDILDNLISGQAADLLGGPASVGLSAVTLTSAPPIGQGGFGISIASGGLQITPGRFYADGVVGELATPAAGGPVAFTAQRDLPLPFLCTGVPAASTAAPAFTPLATGTYLVFLDTWQRHVTALEDPLSRELALGGPDTATRSQTVAQVKLLPATGATCGVAVPAFDQLVAPTTPGTMFAQAVAPTAATTPCDVGAGGGFTGLQNQLYRVEIHQGGTLPGNVTFKWSRDNGSIASALTTASAPSFATPVLVLQSVPVDDAHGFSIGDWVEVLDDKIELQGRPGLLVKLTKVDGVNLTFDPANVRNSDGTTAAPSSPPTAPLGGLDLTANPKIRRWDQNSANSTTGTTTLTAGVLLALESGVQVQFGPGTYRAGDYWLIPARTAIGTSSGIEWPLVPNPPPPGLTAGAPMPLRSKGIVHHYARLAIVDYTSGTTFLNLQDCRKRVPALSTLSTDDVAFSSLTPSLVIPPAPAPQTLTAALQVLATRTAPPTKVRASILATNSITLTNAASPQSTVFSLLNNMSLPNLTFNNADSTGRVAVMVRLMVQGVNPQKATGITEGDVEFNLVVTPVSTGIPIVIATSFEAYFAGTSGFFEVHHIYMERLLAGLPQTPANAQAIGGLLPGQYSFSANWSIKSPTAATVTVAACTGSTTRELTVIEL